MTNPLTNMTLLNYPPMPPQSDTWGIHPHKDFNLLTLLAHDPIGGLEVRNRADEWISAECPPDGLVLNVGDMLELWSGGRLISTPHRVFNKSGKPRQSFPFFRNQDLTSSLNLYSTQSKVLIGHPCMSALLLQIFGTRIGQTQFQPTRHKFSANTVRRDKIQTSPKF